MPPAPISATISYPPIFAPEASGILRDYTAELVRGNCIKKACQGARHLYNCGRLEAPMMRVSRVALLGALLAGPSMAAAQTSAPPAAPDVLRELLVEVRGLRAAMERAATV